jgi:tetratricopeptide (TPR) repeat protein
MPKLAARCLQNLLARAGENLPVRMLLFQILNEANLPGEARRNAEALYSMAPGLPASAATLAQVYLDQDEGELALMVLQRALDANPGDQFLVMALAGALLRQDRPDEARARLQQLNPENAEQLTAVRIGAFANARLGNWPGAEACCRRAASAAPGEPVRLLYAAAVAHQGRYGEARELLGRLAATAEKPGCAPAVSPASAADAVQKEQAGETMQNLATGWAYFHARLFKAALETLEPSLDSTDPEPLLGPLFVCILHGLPADEQVVRARQLAEAHADSPEAQLGLSRVYAAHGDQQAERAALDTAARLAPDSLPVIRARAQFYERIGDAEQAIQAYRRLAQLAPDDAAVNNNLAYALLTGGGNPTEALPIAERASSLSPPNSGIFHTLGLAQFMSGRFEESRKSLWQALELRPLDPTVLFDYGQALMATDQREDGQRQIALAVTLSDQLGLDFPRRAEAQKILDGS